MVTTVADLRDDIVRASIEVGAQLGEDGLTMRAIAARLGMSVTGLYQYFDGKAAILREIRSRGVRMLQRALLAIEPTDDRAERLRQMAHAYVAFARANPWLYGVVFLGNELDWTTMSAEERNERLLPLQIAGAMFEEGIARGEFRADLDPGHAVQMTWAALHGVASLAVGTRLSAEHPAFPVQSVEGFIALFVETLVRSCAATPLR